MNQETIDRIRKFTADREWEQYHTPANLAKSISIESNELLECFQWSDTDYDLEHAGLLIPLFLGHKNGYISMRFGLLLENGAVGSIFPKSSSYYNNDS